MLREIVFQYCVHREGCTTGRGCLSRVIRGCFHPIWRLNRQTSINTGEKLPRRSGFVVLTQKHSYMLSHTHKKHTHSLSHTHTLTHSHTHAQTHTHKIKLSCFKRRNRSHSGVMCTKQGKQRQELKRGVRLSTEGPNKHQLSVAKLESSSLYKGREELVRVCDSHSDIT